MTEQFLTVAQVAQRLQVSHDTVERLIAKKKLRAKKIGRVYRISEKWLQEYIEQEDR